MRPDVMAGAEWASELRPQIEESFKKPKEKE
jgi:hypothetical protein